MPLLKGFGAVYHPNPMDAKRIGELCIQYRPGILLTTPTFCKGLIRKCEPDSFTSLHHIVTGAERLPAAVAREFQEKFGVDLLEGYGCTEMSPVVAVNTHDYQDERILQKSRKAGTVGQPLPGIAIRILNSETGELLPPNQEGLLFVRGANQMLGYWQKPELTAQVIQDGWYNTGDIARVDEEGFLTITDRLSRFSKIGGEMVPHLKIEEAISEMIPGGYCAVTAVPDPSKGERLIALIADAQRSPLEIWRALKDGGLPLLWIPKAEDIYAVAEIPALASGKRDLGQIQKLAQKIDRPNCQKTAC
jgi:acyl-[acyl-carrier-protein]-phospholipid O-acyltransferase / long-chain-fatty-acid--[acyl-carrier-protein] ligase